MESEAFHAALERLRAGEPLGYILEHVPFLDTTIYLDNQPLIPRVETEWWVEKAIAEIKKAAAGEFVSEKPRGAGLLSRGEASLLKPVASGELDSCFEETSLARGNVRILDLCAGSGAIGVAVAKAVPEACVDFVEIDARLLLTIEKNLRQNNITPDRVRLFQSDLFQNIPDTQYDFILSNPPYIDRTLDRVDPSVKTYEPDLALYGGKDGMEIIARIVEGARAKLAPHGQLWIEHEPEQSGALATLAHTHHFSITTHKDQYEVERYSVLVLK